MKVKITKKIIKENVDSDSVDKSKIKLSLAAFEKVMLPIVGKITDLEEQIKILKEK